MMGKQNINYVPSYAAMKNRYCFFTMSVDYKTVNY